MVNWFPSLQTALSNLENHCEVMDSVMGRTEDRISNLPDSLLCHILSFLLTKHVVRTSILSMRWRYIWTTVPNLDFDAYELFHEYIQMREDRQEEIDLRFQHSVNRVLLLSKAPCFQKFHLKGFLSHVNHLDTWISSAIKRNVQDLKLCNWDPDYIKAPCILFTSKTLMVLTLVGVFLNVDHSVWLLSLKTLNLDTVQYNDVETMQHLLSGCPVLEELFIQQWIGHTHPGLDIFVPTLKRFKLFHHRWSLEDEEGDEGFKLVVNFPQLECLSIIDCVSKDFLLKNLNSLSKASIVIGPGDLIINRFNGDCHVYKVLSGISNVRFLDVCFPLQNDVIGYMLPTFQNLIQLTFRGTSILKLLTGLLQCSPSLEVLVLEVNELSDEAIKSWSPPEQVPSCFSSHLKEIQVKELRGKDYELYLIEYFLKKAKVLEKMTTDCRQYYCFCGRVSALRKESKTCQLNINCMKHHMIEELNGDGEEFMLV